VQQTWTQSEKLKKLNLKLCSAHGKLFSAKPGGQCKKCASEPPTKTCKRGHVRSADAKRCAQCAKERRRKPSGLSDEQRAANKEAAELRAARRAGLGLYQ
jgi:hypothetical protein